VYDKATLILLLGNDEYFWRLRDAFTLQVK